MKSSVWLLEGELALSLYKRMKELEIVPDNRSNSYKLAAIVISGKQLLSLQRAITLMQKENNYPAALAFKIISSIARKFLINNLFYQSKLYLKMAHLAKQSILEGHE